MNKIISTLFILLCPLMAKAQVGEHRNQYAIGVHGGCNLSRVKLLPKVNQKLKQGIDAGLIVRYTCEKYFKTICAIQAEINFSQMGWEEDILDIKNQPVPSTKNPEENEYYRRTLNYIQVPILAHLAWGKESNGLNFFLNAGPQFGFLQSEKTETNFTPETANFQDRTNKVVAQDTMKVENKLDYGITAGIGAELHVKNIGRFQLEARYYYGLGNLYGDSKRDYFASSRSANITIRAAYLFDL